MANPFGFGGNSNPFITQVLFPAVANTARNQTQNSKTYQNPLNTRENVNFATTGETADPVEEIDQTEESAEIFGGVENLSLRDRFRRAAATEDLNKSTVSKLKQAKAASQDTAASRGRFTEVDRLPFVLTCQKWINDTSGKTLGPLSSYVTAAGIKTATDDEVSAAAGTLNNLNTQQLQDSQPKEKYIFCNVNPSDVSWSFPIRAVDQLTMAGRVQHVWRSNTTRRSYFDEPSITFTFQSGNIMPLRFSKSINDSTGAEVLEDATPGLPAGLSNFYKFFELYNQPRIIPGVSGKDRAVNYMYIFYNSRAFPRMTLRGMWKPEGVAFTENADNPNQLTWTASFTVYDSFPTFGNPEQMVASFTAAGFGGTRDGDKLQKFSATAPDNTSIPT